MTKSGAKPRKNIQLSPVASLKLYLIEERLLFLRENSPRHFHVSSSTAIEFACDLAKALLDGEGDTFNVGGWAPETRNPGDREKMRSKTWGGQGGQGGQDGENNKDRHWSEAGAHSKDPLLSKRARSIEEKRKQRHAEKVRRTQEQIERTREYIESRKRSRASEGQRRAAPKRTRYGQVAGQPDQRPVRPKPEEGPEQV